MEDTVAAGYVRSVQNIGWPLNPPRNVDPTCVYTIRYFKDKANKDLVMPAVWFEDPVDPWCRKGIKLYRQKVSPKTEIRESKDILDGKPHISSKNLFIMVIDPRHAGDRCRFKMHYTGCSKKDKKGGCLKVFSDRFVEAKRQTQKVETRTSGSARSCALRDYSANPNQLGLSVASDAVESYSSLVALDLVLPPAERNPTRGRGRRSAKSKGKSKRNRTKKKKKIESISNLDNQTVKENILEENAKENNLVQETENTITKFKEKNIAINFGLEKNYKNQENVVKEKM
jgi:hypothetical protein